MTELTEGEAVSAFGPNGTLPAQLETRRRLFGLIDGHVKARVQETLPGVFREAREKLHGMLDPQKEASAISVLYVDAKRKLSQFNEDLDSKLERAVELSLRDAHQRYAKEIISAFERKVAAIVARECSKQLRRLLNPAPVKAPKAKKKARR